MRLSQHVKSDGNRSVS